VKPISHIVGRDPIPQDLLDEVTKDLIESAEREGGRVEDGVRVNAPPQQVEAGATVGTND
jgi:hypothetical protein